MRPSIRHRLAAFVVVLGIVSAPGLASGQACLSSPAPAGGFTAGPRLSLEDGASGYFFQGRANLEGPLVIGSTIGMLDLDHTDRVALATGGTLAFETPMRGLSVCPNIGFSHVTWSERPEGASVDLSELAFPLGVAGGRRIGGPSAVLIPSLGAGVLFQRAQRSGSGAGATRVTENDVAGYASGAAALVLRRFFLRTEVSTTSLEDAEVMLSLELGLIL